MSILSTTNSGFKYFSPEGIIKRCCELTLDGMRVGIRVTVCEDGGVDICPDVDPANIKFKLYFQSVYKNECPVAVIEESRRSIDYMKLGNTDRTKH